MYLNITVCSTNDNLKKKKKLSNIESPPKVFNEEYLEKYKSKAVQQ